MMGRDSVFEMLRPLLRKGRTSTLALTTALALSVVTVGLLHTCSPFADFFPPHSFDSLSHNHPLLVPEPLSGHLCGGPSGGKHAADCIGCTLGRVLLGEGPCVLPARYEGFSTQLRPGATLDCSFLHLAGSAKPRAPPSL